MLEENKKMEEKLKKQEELVKNKEKRISSEIKLAGVAGLFALLSFLYIYSEKIENIIFSEKKEVSFDDKLNKKIEKTIENNITKVKEIVEITSPEAEKIKNLLNSFADLHKEVIFLLDEKDKDSKEIKLLKNTLKNIFLEEEKKNFPEFKEEYKLSKEDISYFSKKENIELFYNFIEKTFTNFNDEIKVIYSFELDKLNQDFAEIFINFENNKELDKKVENKKYKTACQQLASASGKLMKI